MFINYVIKSADTHECNRLTLVAAQEIAGSKNQGKEKDKGSRRQR